MNRFLRPLGLTLKRTNAPTRSFAEFFKHLRAQGIDFRTVIDVGVGPGTPQIYDAYPKAHYVLVEPVEEFASVLAELARRLDAEVHGVVAGNEDSEVEFNVHEDLTGSSILSQAEGAVLDGEPRTVPQRRLDSLLAGSTARPCLLKVDAQGWELEVLEGLGARLEEMDVIILETSLLEFRVGAPLLADIVAWMNEHRFAVYDVLEGHTRALDDALAQVDLAFVRHDSPLRADPRFFSEEQVSVYQARWGR